MAIGLIIGGALVFVFFGLIILRGAPYVPSHRVTLEHALSELYVLSADDTLIDIGSGDGIVLRVATRRGARAIGYELNPLLVLLARWLSRHTPRVQVKLADFWFVSFPPETTIVYTFGESRDIGRMADKVEREATRLGRPLYFMSHGFAVPGRQVLRQSASHFLYKLSPVALQNAQA